MKCLDIDLHDISSFNLLDELIRQVTINCAERGLLLLQVRDEIRMTIAAYQTLYESSVAFGMRKALQGEQGKSDMENKVLIGIVKSKTCFLWRNTQEHLKCFICLYNESQWHPNWHFFTFVGGGHTHKRHNILCQNKILFKISFCVCVCVLQKKNHYL